MKLYAPIEIGFIQPMPRRSIPLILFALLIALGAQTQTATAQNDYKRIFDEDNLPPVRELLLSGRYDLVARLCESAVSRGQPSVEWRLMRYRAMSELGRSREAFEEAKLLLETAYGKQLRTLVEIRRLALRVGETGFAEKLLTQLNEAALAMPEKDRTAGDLVALGEAAIALGADPATVLEQYFDRAKKIDEAYVDAYLAAGELALDKSDFARAAKEFQAGLKFSASHPDLNCGLARAFFPDDRQRAVKLLLKAIERNPQHTDSLLVEAEYLIDTEHYDEAEQILAGVITRNATEPRAWAYQSALAELARNDHAEADEARLAAFADWDGNPEVDHLIGRVLSRNYRFAEGADHQRQSLEKNPDFLPAKIQLAHDLLRLGDEDTAWQLADEVAEADAYNVLAFNLTVLRDEMKDYVTLQSPEFTVRMPREEAEIYGDRALEILNEARDLLCKKYGLDLDHPVLVEFFPHQQDFAIRTFGNLGGGGILGACFGTVVTMNSPGGLAAQRNNWEATLWHEFCHVVTLTVTKNRMPRWLSEGISVYEEIQRNPAWGEHMNLTYRSMILDGDALTPISQLSSAFYAPESGQHLMFAYYESSQVVEYLIDGWGEEAFRNILRDLADGVLINDAISRHTGPMEELEQAFAAQMKTLAEAYGSEVEWEPPEAMQLFTSLGVPTIEAAEVRLRRNPKAWWAQKLVTENFLADQKWQQAADAAQKLIDIFPAAVDGESSGYALRAAALRGLGDAEGEAATLRELASRSAEAWSAYDRLMELDLEAERWPELEKNTRRARAINPFSKRLHYCAGCAHEALERKTEAVSSFEKLLTLKPANPSEVRYRLAGLMRDDQPETARRHLLDALADAPRYRDAHRLLLEFAEGKSVKNKKTDTEPASQLEPIVSPIPQVSAPSKGKADPIDPKPGAPLPAKSTPQE